MQRKFAQPATCATPVRLMDSAGQADGYIRCTETFQEASVTHLSPRTKPTSKLQPEGKERPSQSLAKHLETYQELTKSSTTQSYTCIVVHLSQNPTQGGTGRSGGEHRSDRSKPGHSRWTASRGSTPSNNLPDLSIHSTDLHKTLWILGLPHGHPIATIWSTKTC
jgi:hypothetical protein